MAKKKSAKPKAESYAKPLKRKATKKLSERGERVLSFVLNSIAFETHSKDGDLDSIAQHLGVDANRLRPTLKKMADLGAITIEGSGEFVYPTAKTLRKQMPHMSVAEAEKLLRKLHRR